MRDMRGKSDDVFRVLVENAPIGIYYSDFAGRFLFGNRKAEAIVGYTAEELVGKNFLKLRLLSTKDIKKAVRLLALNRLGKSTGPDEFGLKRKDGDTRIVEINTSIIVIDGKKAVMGMVQDITDRKRAEELIKASLIEKEVLLKEIHHRVKNNLQIVSSLLSLQACTTKEAMAIEELNRAQTRIKSMALIHQQLYSSENLSHINFAEYLNSLAEHLFSSLQTTPSDIVVNLDIQEIFLKIDSAIPCGLIFNELITNSMKYAFPNSKNGEISVKMSKDKNDMCTLVISDTGIGIPEEIDLRNTETLGLQLVDDLTRQLRGTIELDRSGGTTWTLRFGGNNK